MINSVGSGYNAMAMTGSKQVQKPPPPPQGKDVFQAADTDGNGTVSQTELETLLQGINEVTGENISVEDGINKYDTDQDGALSGEELLELMVDSGLPRPGAPGAEGEQGGVFPPIEISSEQAVASYAQNSGQDTIDQLLELLQSKDDDNSGMSSSLDITS